MLCQYSSRAAKRFDLGEHEKHADHQRAGTAHAGGRRQVARQGDVGAAVSAGEVSRHAPGDASSDSSTRSRSAVSIRDRRESESSRRSGASMTVDLPVVARHGRHAESAFGRGHHRAAARIVGVLAQHFDPSRHEERQRRLNAASLAGDRQRRRRPWRTAGLSTRRRRGSSQSSRADGPARRRRSGRPDTTTRSWPHLRAVKQCRPT